MSRSPGAELSADYNLRILWPLARWVEDHSGSDTLAQLARSVGLAPADFDGSNRWISAQAFESLLTDARALVGSDDEFKSACAYRIREAYGPLRYVLWALSPATVLEKAVRNLHLVTAVEEGEIVRLGRTSVELRFRGTFGRLACLLRQAQSEALPTVWGLPPAHVEVRSCVAHGDPYCEWRVDWYAHRGWMPTAFGAIGLGLVGWVLVRFGFATVPTPVFLSILGGALGYLAEVRRTERINAGTREQVTEALRQMASQEAEARREMLGMNQRQKEWTRLVEEQVGERTSTLEQVVNGMQDLQKERVSRVLGFSHDLRNPLQVIQFAAEVMRVRSQDDEYLIGVVVDMEQAVGQMKRMLSELVKTASSQQRTTMQLAPRRIEVQKLTDSLTRRIRALAYGRNVRTHVFRTRESPDAIEIDPLLLDRIVDNLLTNATKYTERGNIVVELDGSPGFLVIKVSDTGCGIDPADIDKIFKPGGSSLESRRGDSFGVGLSVVVQLLDQIGGRLEVMSKPQEGTTFWVHVPLNLPSVESQEQAAISAALPRASTPVGLSRVVHVRRLTA